MKFRISAAVAAAGLMLAAHAGAVTLDFENLTEGTVLSNQYAALGAVFSPNAFSGAGGPTSDWATNTDMTVTATDLGGTGTPAGVTGGNMLHAFGNTYGGWLSEDGDPSFRITFATPMSSVSAAFAGVFTPTDVHLIAFNGATQLADVAGSGATGGNLQFVLGFSAASITSVVITAGSFDDWVGVDNITFTPAVPEVGTYSMMALGLGLLALRRRNRS